MKTQAQEGKAWVSYSFLATVWNDSILHKVRTDHPLMDNEASIWKKKLKIHRTDWKTYTEPGISTDIMWILLLMWSIMQLILTIFACVLQRSLCCSWICWQTPLPSRPAEKKHQNKDIQWRKILIYTLLLKSSLRLSVSEVICLAVGRFNAPLWSHLLAGVPVECRPLQDEPEALPLLGDKDVGLLSLLPQPAITVGSTQLAARHATPTHSRRHS